MSDVWVLVRLGERTAQSREVTTQALLLNADERHA